MDFYDILFAKSQNKGGGGGGGGGGNPYNSVVFYDYDGSIVASYSKAEFTVMPENPSHEGLVAQGWNWTKAEIDDYLNDYPEATVNVGQMYITDDGKTRLYVHFEKGRTSPYLGLGVNGTVEVDWGDGSPTDTLTGTSLTTAVHVQHVYQPGDYVIKLTPTSGNYSIFGVSNTSHILKKDAATTAYESRVYAKAIKKVELGLDVSIGSYAFAYCHSLVSVTTPSSVTSIGECAFGYCYSLAPITIPNSVTSIGNSAFSSCYSLASVTMPNSVTSIGYSAFSSCYSIVSVTTPSSVTTIGNNAFSGCYGVSEYHFLSTTPPTLGSTVFRYIPSDCIIYVPMASVEAYKTAIGWSNYASQIQGE